MFKGGVQRRLYFCAQRFEMSAPDARNAAVRASQLSRWIRSTRAQPRPARRSARGCPQRENAPGDSAGQAGLHS